MQALRANLPIAITLALSLALHLFVVFPVLGVLGNASGRDGGDGAEPVRRDRDGGDRGDADDGGAERDRNAERAAENSRRTLQERRDRVRNLPPELRDREEEVRLGIDSSPAVTMNWIGYDEYEQHLAELADVEQAAFRLQAASGSRGTASPLLPPSPPAPAVAVSPNPSESTLPAAAAGVDQAPPTNLVSQPTPDPASPAPASPPTDAAPARGSDPELARPLPPPEMPAVARPTPDSGVAPSDSPASQDPSLPAPATTPSETDPRNDPSAPSKDPSTPSPVVPNDPSNGLKPAPPPREPSRTDPRNEPRTDPTQDAPPSEVDPSKSMNPAPSGAAPDSPPRDENDPTSTSAKPPQEAPVDPRDPNAPRDATIEPSAQNPAGDPAVLPTDGRQGGGAPGAQPVDGASTTPAPPAPAGEPGDSTAKSGALSDRESDPTSIIEVPMSAWRNGKPLAAKGIELRPVRPRFTTLNLLDGIARNPIGELVIGRDGVPQVARIVRSTGNPGVDEAIRSALFKWRASGDQLEKLKPGQTVTIRLRLVMLKD
jgi:hypothetical protein